MRTTIHPAARRIVWLIITIGAVATLVAIVYILFNLGSGITLPFMRTALDIGWLFVFGVMWLIVGLILWWWLRPIPGLSDDAETIQQWQAALNKRLTELETRLNTPQPIIQTTPDAAEIIKRLDSLDKEVDSLATTIQDAHVRLNSLDDVTSQLHDLDTQLDSLYVTLQDVHRRIDSLEQANNP
ncbi:MAG: hypothetical protein ABI947_23705 [Chloroflexota bacterium]